MVIKVVALSCAGTITYRDAQGDPHRESFSEPFRFGLRSFVYGCRERDIKIVFTSKSPSWRVQHTLKTHIENNPTDNGWWRMGSSVVEYCTLEGTPKDFSFVLEREGITPRELFVIGSNEQRDIAGAIKIGAYHQRVRPYIEPLDWSNLGEGLIEGFGSIIPKHIKLFGRLNEESPRVVPAYLTATPVMS